MMAELVPQTPAFTLVRPEGNRVRFDVDGPGPHRLVHNLGSYPFVKVILPTGRQEIAGAAICHVDRNEVEVTIGMWDLTGDEPGWATGPDVAYMVLMHG